MLTAFFFTSCEGTKNEENAEISIENVENSDDDIVLTTSIDEDGKTLDLKFNNTKGLVTIDFNGKTAVLTSEKPASGIWYKNDEYELRGKGDDIELKKDGVVIFSDMDEVKKSTVTNDEGQTLEMSFNNTKNEATVYFSGQVIELKGQKPASGIWYKNENFELRGKGDDIELTKDGEVVFKN